MGENVKVEEMAPEEMAIRYQSEVIDLLSNSEQQLQYVLTSVANSVQERLGEEIVLIPQVFGEDEYEEDDLRAYILTFSLVDEETQCDVKKHYIVYGLPPLEKDNLDGNLLRITLDVGHELGHLLLENGPGEYDKELRTGIQGDDLYDTVKEIEADWMAICLLQMYGYCHPGTVE